MVAPAQEPSPCRRGAQGWRVHVPRQSREDKVLVQSPSSPRPALMTQAEFEAVWDGRLVFMTRRAGLLDLSRRFDITWFLGAIHKVLVHRNMSTLDVLILGLVAVGMRSSARRE
jgi:ATP-binding cassette, subfamily B, bacterial HlyB/CyaB